MTPSQSAKTAGLKNLAKMSELTGYDRHTLAQWHKSRPVVFEALLMWCKSQVPQFINIELKVTK